MAESGYLWVWYAIQPGQGPAAQADAIVHAHPTRRNSDGCDVSQSFRQCKKQWGTRERIEAIRTYEKDVLAMLPLQNVFVARIKAS